jgi:hypothetical protein
MHPFVKRFAVAMSLLLGIVPVAEAQQDLWRGVRWKGSLWPETDVSLISPVMTVRVETTILSSWLRTRPILSSITAERLASFAGGG